MPIRTTAPSRHRITVRDTCAATKHGIRLNPLAHAVALLLLAGNAQAQQAFSPAWFANKGAVQNSAAATGQLPNGVPAASLTGPQRQSQAARERLKQSLDNLATTAQAIAAQQALQRNSRAAALGSVPDGLGEGGLKVDENALTRGWLNASAPTQSAANGKTTVTIEQTGAKAILNWETFNVGRNTVVDFNQRADWAALNRVNDPSARPSQIQGQISAEGTVLVVNRNGVMFSGSSQVNARNLVAAAANFSDEQFIARGLYSQQQAGSLAPSFTDAAGDVIVEAGAQIATATPTDVRQGGGYVLLLGNEVRNAGEITTTRGQALLAAGDDFVIRKGVGTEANTFSTTRGHEVLARRDEDSEAGVVANTGLITAREGDITLTGHHVRQDGVAVSTTTVNQRGTIHLSNPASDAEGEVALGRSAVTAVLIEDDGRTTALDSQRDALIAESKKQDQLRFVAGQLGMGGFDNLSQLSDRRDQSRVEIVSGSDVRFEGESLTVATGGQIAVSAEGRVFAADKAKLDVSGAVGVQVAMEGNNVQVNVQGNELRDSPVNRDSGDLFNNTVWIDRRHLIHVPAGTGGYEGERWYAAGGLLEVGGYLSNQGHGIGEWAAQGGSVVLDGNEVVTQRGSSVNLSGGSLDVQTGYAYQTWLRGADGRLYNLNDASANMVFDGVYKGFEETHERWGDTVTGFYYNPLIAPQQRLENGYTVGRDAGRLTVSAPTAVLEGDIVADVFNGEQQGRARDDLDDGYRQAQTAVARAGTLAYERTSAMGANGAFDTQVSIGEVANIADAWNGAEDVMPEDRIGTLSLDAARLSDARLGGLHITTADEIHIDRALTLDDGGELHLNAAVTQIDADVTARSGAISVGNVAPAIGSTGVALADAILLRDGTSSFSLSEGATLDLRGLWTNDALDGNPWSSTAYVDGGDLVTRLFYGSIVLEAGSVVDVSSGATLKADGDLVGGRGGDVRLLAGLERGGLNPFDVRLQLDGEIRAQGVTGGGELELRSPGSVLFGEDALLQSGVLPAGTAAPFDFTLEEELHVPAGGVVPLPTTVNRTFTELDVPAPLNLTIGTISTPIVLAASWTVPPGMTLRDARSNPNGIPIFYRAGQVVPAGTSISRFDGAFPMGTVVPSAVFPNGIPFQPYKVALAAGDIAPVAISYAARTVVPRGTRFEQEIAFRPALQLEPTLFRTGFSDYSITSLGVLDINSGTRIRAEVPVLSLAPHGLQAASGDDPALALESWTPPVFQEDAVHARMSQREGASLTLQGTDVGLAADSSIEVDPGEQVRLVGSGQVTVEGDITAPGGDIVVMGGSALDGRSLWIGEDAVLDAAGRAYTALDQNGRRYGVVQDGGSIRIGIDDYDRSDKDQLDVSAGHVVIREGARLEASGAAAQLDMYAGYDPLHASNVVDVAGDGGLIRLGSRRGILNDGQMRAAAGGAGAAGGELGLALENADNTEINVRTLTITQERVGSGMAADLQPGVDDPSLVRGVARISAEQVEAGGFDTLDLWSRDVLSFEGDVNLALGRALHLRRGVIGVADATPEAQVRLSAPYVLLDGKSDRFLQVDQSNGADVGLAPIGTPSYGSLLPSAHNTGAMDIEADLIDVGNYVLFGASGALYSSPSSSTPVDVAGFDSLTLTSRGDVRFVSPATEFPLNPGSKLAAGGDMTITASQLYPATHASGAIEVGRISLNSFDPERSLVIRGYGETPAVPLSVFGSLTLSAANIDQGGVVRAPLGRILLGHGSANSTDSVYDVTLRNGSVTSTSAEGLTLPYGGTADGLRYLYNGKDVAFVDLADLNIGTNSHDLLETGVVMRQATLTAENGSLIDVSGGGELLGAGFFTGRGGSVDVLRTSLFNANPANGFSSPDAQVYAIVPGTQPGYAPIAPDAGAGQPRIGQQITLTQAVGDLAAGTYTLMPSIYALLPGAYRVELGGEVAGPNPAPFAMPAGSFSGSAHLGVANTGIRDVLPTAITLTPGEVVRTHSQYNETSYAQFAISNAARFGALRPRLERDAQSIHLDFASTGDTPLDFEGVADIAGAKDGTSGNLFLTAHSDIEIKAEGATATDGFTSLDAQDINGLDAGTLTVGGTFGLVQAVSGQQGATALGPRVVFQSTARDVVVRDGAQLTAGQIFLTGSGLTVESGAVLDTTGGRTDGISSSLGYVFSDTFNEVHVSGGAILTVANGFIDFNAPLRALDGTTNSITVEDGAALRTLGTIGFTSSGAVEVGDAELGARYVSLFVPQINIGTDASFAAAEADGILGDGVRFNQATLAQLVRPTRPGLVPVERISLTVGESINLFGDVDFDLRNAAESSDAMLVLNSPAIYGWGEAGDVGRIGADTLVWNGLSSGTGAPTDPYSSLDPGAVTPGGAGTGAGRLVLDAREIVFGYDPLARTQDQVALDRLALGFSSVDLNASERITANNRGTLSVYQGGTDAASYSGGALTLITPLLTGAAGSFMKYGSGGALTVSAPAGSGAASTQATDALGAEVRLDGKTVSVDTGVALPSGRLVIDADEGITLGDRANVDLSGRALTFFDVTKYSWGGDLVMETADGAVTQNAGSRIDVSATDNDAGSIKATATGGGGAVALAGTLLGGASAGFDSGAFDVRATRLDDFAGLNAKLNTGGFFNARSFVVKTGDLTVGSEVRANEVAISVDGGSLTVDGTIDASGEEVGTIRLAARDDLALTGNALLDVHGTRLATDAYGQAIEASNRGEIELTSRAGTVDLASGARMDLRSADDVSRGRININAPRIGGDGVAVNAAGGVIIDGAASIAVNAFASYTPADRIVNEGYLDAIHADSTAFIDAANANAAVDARLGGLKAYGTSFHLRPGVEIVSDGDLTVHADLDLSGYRYGPDADASIRGSGEPGVLTIRAGGDLDINGSINDGFAPPPATPDDKNWIVLTEILRNGQPAAEQITFVPPFNPGWGDNVYDFPNGASVLVVSGSVSDWFGVYMPGDEIPGFLYGEAIIEAGTVLTAANPSDADIAFSGPRAEPGRLWAVAPMLDPGMLSWSMRLVGGADTQAADSRTLAAASALGGRGDVVLSDAHKAGPTLDHSALSVVRTGTGYLDVLAGGDYRQESLYGVYTAGTQVADSGAWNELRALREDGSVLGLENAGYESTLAMQRMYFTEGGGDLRLVAQGDVRGFTEINPQPGYSRSSDDIGRWLWRQGGSELDQLTAWGINFGQYRHDREAQAVELVGFSGIGTLGGGDVTVVAGGDAGSTTSASSVSEPFETTALNVVVAGSGRVDGDNRLIQTGGGTLTLDVGGRINTGVDEEYLYSSSGRIMNLRGDASVRAGSIGQTRETGYGLSASGDPRAADTHAPLTRFGYSPLGVAMGDGMATIRSRGDISVLTGQDAGRVKLRGGDTLAGDDAVTGSGTTSFSLWTDRSGIDLFASGGDIRQTPQPAANFNYDPGRFTAVAANGSVVLDNLALAPSQAGDLQLFARWNVLTTESNLTSVDDGVAMSSASRSAMATPLNAAWFITAQPLLPGVSDFLATNANFLPAQYTFDGANLFAFGLDTPSHLHAGSSNPIRIYAVNGDIAARTGVRLPDIVDGETLDSIVAAKPVAMRAGRDILASGLILNNDADDVSVVQAGRDILNTTLDISGPGLLEVTAGRNIHQALANGSTITSIGPLVPGDTRPGADILLSAGMGAGGPDYAAFADLYLDPANRADPEQRLADQPGKVVKTYEKELADWLQERFGYRAAGDSDALAYFSALPQSQQGVFLREVYFEELRQGGREYNDPDSRRFQSYLRGRNAIATLLPEKDADGNAIVRDGSISFQGAAGVHTNFGGDIQVFAPGGGLTLGVNGVAPPSSTGLVTLGEGDIEIFTQGDVLLGLSRIMTTLGGGITAWSVEGDINAGRGSKTALVYTPPRVVYDDLGNITLSPNVPSSGAGIATLDPVPGTEPGDVDLIAPLGTIDVGEAGIRVSGNVNFAALQVVNAANVQVKGDATGLPPTTVVNTAALTSASAAASNATQAVQEMTRQQQDAARRAQPSIISVQVLGFGTESSRIEAPRNDGPTLVRQGGYDPSSAFQVLGNGELSAEQQARLTTAERRKLQEPE
ncbi:filamentous haemagglutinin family protein [Lysobacter sp.]|uniref:filamentous haemagglutinin family protein n=1 Tax=Lysobacter sp. TaxID=72226 RepID=UPI002D6AAB4B|nr:filamentous haemagglutinin family protein [Lysobacter sp.]HZX78189.1 filamentous hemagglutinin family protein [Lysobacter sp.]